MKHILKVFLFTTLLLGFFGGGVLIGASKFKEAMGDVKWTDVGSLTVTTLGLVIAFLSYSRWLKNKIKDDAYLATKTYLNVALSFKTQTLNLAHEYNLLVPAPGVIVESAEKIQARVARCHELYTEINKSGLELSVAKEQLTFWRVGLTEAGEKLHNNLLELLGNQAMYSYALNSQINYFYFHERTNITELTNQLEGWRKLGKDLVEIHEKILISGFNGIFSIKKI